MPPRLSPWSYLFSVSRNPALWCHCTARKGEHSVLRVDCGSQYCVVFAYHRYLHLPVRHPCLRFLPAFRRVSWIRRLKTWTQKWEIGTVCRYSLLANSFPEVMIVSQVCMLLIVANALLTKWLESRFCHTSVCCDEWKDRSQDIFSVNSFTSNVRVLICLVSVRCLLPWFTRGGKLSYCRVLRGEANCPFSLRFYQRLLPLAASTKFV